jgi:DNA gyrase subunit A
VRGAKVAEGDVVAQVVYTSAHAFLLFFTNRGKVYRIKAHELPKKDRTHRGVLAQSVLPLEPDEVIQAVVDTRDYETHQYLVMATRLGQVKKTRFADYDSRNSTLIAINLHDGDELVTVRTTTGDKDLLLFTRAGMGIRFAERDIRATGRDTQGVRGIRLREGDEVISAVSSDDADHVLLITSGGYGKRTAMDRFPRQKRGGVGVKAMKLTRVRGELIAGRSIAAGAEVFLISSDGVVIRTEGDSISRQQRDATGVKVMNLAPDAVVSAVTPVPADEPDED